jgi:CheY-like chemotaxis protein
MDAGVKKTVLYVEDNAVNLYLVEAIFVAKPNCHLLTATHAALGLELARTRHLDLILLDLNLPDMNGAEFLQKLRADPATAAIPVVVISADAFTEQRGELQKQGIKAFITKPFDLSELEAEVDRVLRNG